VKVLVDSGYGSNGEYVGLDVKAMRTQKVEDSYEPVTGKAGLITEWFVEGRKPRAGRQVRRRTSRALHEQHAEGRPQVPA
jgi:hypothetical protein